MPATFSVSGYPLCCGVSLTPMQPVTTCAMCGESFSYAELRRAIADRRGPVRTNFLVERTNFDPLKISQR